MIDPTDPVTRALDVTTDAPTRLNFRSDDRLYVVTLVQDLFQDWVVMQSWGGRYSQRGGGKIRAVASHDEGIAQLRRVTRQRLAHEYALVEQCR